MVVVVIVFEDDDDEDVDDDGEDPRFPDAFVASRSSRLLPFLFVQKKTFEYNLKKKI